MTEMPIDKDSPTWGYQGQVEEFISTPTIVKLTESDAESAQYLASMFNARARVSSVLPNLQSLYRRAIADMSPQIGGK